MAAYYPSLSSPKNILHSPSYLVGPRVASLQSSDLPENTIYLNQHSQWLSGNSFSGHDYEGVHSVGSRDEMSLISQNGNTAMVDQQIFSQKMFDVRNEGIEFQGLSLSLGTDIPSTGPMSSYQNHYTIQGSDPWMSSSIGNSQYGEGKIAKYLSFDLDGGSRDIVKFGDTRNPQFSMNSGKVNLASNWHDTPGIAGNLFDAKYLKAAQDLLDEVVNVRGSLKQPGKHQNSRSLGEDVPEETDLKCKTSSELGAIERQDLLNKMTKLWSMLEEVDIKYRRYRQQMQLLVTSFEMVSGCGAAKPYTDLALQTISRQFRHLRDTINKQIQVTQQCLGEQGETENGQGGLPRLRYIDQKLRQQRSVQFGIVRQPWRPQKGLPESAVSVLRAWLFEHFLNPYPKDSEKVMLAKQTGLTRSQVANWFINARVRLWKPMVEEMYKEEFGDTEAVSRNSPEHAPAAQTEKSASENELESAQKSFTYAVSGNDNFVQSKKLRTDDIPDAADMNMHETRLMFKSGNQEADKSEIGQGGLDGIAPTNKTGGGNSIAAIEDSYDVPMLSYTMGDRVSLELGLQQFEKEYQPISSGDRLKHDDTKEEYYSMEPLNQQDRESEELVSVVEIVILRKNWLEIN